MTRARLDGSHSTLTSTGVVYFLQVGDDGPVKIGFTRRNPALRMAALQHGSPFELNWIGYIPAEPAKERELHQTFATFRLRAEWFHPVEPVLDYIKLACPNFDPKKARWSCLRFDLLDEIRSVIRDRPRDWNFVECLENAGVARHEYWRWREGNKAPTEEFLSSIRTAFQRYRDLHLEGVAA